MEDRLYHKCGIFGIYAKNIDVAQLTYLGLHALQHRGQDSSGISVSDSKKIITCKGFGLVAQVFTDKSFKELKGFISIGQNRYATSGGIDGSHIQPVVSNKNTIALAHNGNLPVTKPLEDFLSSKGIPTQELNDSELMHKAIEYYFTKGMTIEEAIKKSFPLFTGSFCLLIMTKNKMIALRDSYGIRPLSIGKLKKGYVVSSETCAIDVVGGKVIRDVKPGEMIVLSNKGMKSYQLRKADQKLDIFEFVYFSRRDSMLMGKRVHEVRKNFGIQLAKEFKIKADVVIPVPESAISASIGYAMTSGIPLDFGLVKNRYIGRTFILPGQKLRAHGVQIKLNPIGDVAKGKSIIIIDDSIVRGTTIKRIVSMFKKYGAREVHVLSSCPPVVFPDFYGIATPSQEELIASHKTIPQIKKYINANSLNFLSYKGMIKATGLSESIFCTSCFTGNYPIDIGDNAKNIKRPITAK
ncbi:MAG: amidophosphoribosyltransferase [bacterium]|nr:amidophosphoribosyltransferase [bacterium]